MSGTNVDGTVLTGFATLTHAVPVPPVIMSPEVVAEDEPDATDPVATTGVVVNWEPVTQSVSGEPVEITAYEVIVTKEVHDDPNGFSRPIFDVHVPADVTSLTLSDEFLESGRVHELEVLAIETSGNQTIGLGFFETE